MEVVKLPPGIRYPSLDIAVEELLEQLILPDDQQTRNELRQPLSTWLVERDGMLVPPISEMVCAVMYWTR